MTTGTIKSVLTEKQEEAKSAKKERKVKKDLNQNTLLEDLQHER